MLCRVCFSHRNFGCFHLVCLIVPSTFVIFPIGITVICNIIYLWMGNLYAATPGQNPGVAHIYIYMYIYIYICSKKTHIKNMLNPRFILCHCEHPKNHPIGLEYIYKHILYFEWSPPWHLFVIVSGIWIGNMNGILSDILFWHLWHSFLAFYLVYLRRFFVVVRRGALWSGACEYCKLELTTLTWQVGKHISFPYIGCLRGIPLVDYDHPYDHPHYSVVQFSLYWLW